MKIYLVFNQSKKNFLALYQEQLAAHCQVPRHKTDYISMEYKKSSSDSLIQALLSKNPSVLLEDKDSSKEQVQEFQTLLQQSKQDDKHIFIKTKNPEYWFDLPHTLLKFENGELQSKTLEGTEEIVLSIAS